MGATGDLASIAFPTVSLANVSLAAPVTQAKEAKKARHFAERQAGKVERQTKKLLAEEERMKRQSAFALLRRRRPGATGPRETILTSPLGAPGQAFGGLKTLLGM